MNKDIDNVILEKKIKEWVTAGEGDFSTGDIDREFDLIEADEKAFRYKVLELMVSFGHIQRVGTRRGWYRRVDRSLNIIDWRGADTKEFDIKLPFSLHEQVRIFPKSLIVISGEKNTGKTAFSLNLVKLNQNRGLPIYYFSSEMLGPEMKVRLQAFKDVPEADWNFTPAHRTENFADVIQPDAINIIDFFEIHDKFWLVGKHMTEIFNRLESGVAIVCVQKSDSSEHGRGGTFLNEKPRLTINLCKRYNEKAELDGATMQITNCKFPRAPYNPNGMMVDYHTYNGSELKPISGWYLPQKK